MTKQELDLIARLYHAMPERCAAARRISGRGLTLSEKIIYSHLREVSSTLPRRGEDTLELFPDRVAMQDATAQTAMLQFMVAGLDSCAVPATIHCDHLITAQLGAERDLERAAQENREVYDFLRSAAARYGLGFWQPGAGIIHQVVLEQYAFPGGLLIGTDSHTPNAGGLGMLAVGVGGADAVDVMAGFSWGLLSPRLVGIRLTGSLHGWASPKDVILCIAGMLTTKGGTGRILEYFGPGARTISCTGKATIANMGAELGATTSVFPFDEKMSGYLKMTGRKELAELAEQRADLLCADAEVEQAPEEFYDQVINIDLSSLEPQWVGPHTPDLLHRVSQMKEVAAENGWPDEISTALIGSCTNSSYQDICRAADIARQAQAAGLKSKTRLLVTPGSDQVYQTVSRDGLLEPFLAAGAELLANACGPCIGQWKREDIKEGKPDTIVTTYNRNFRGRNDGSSSTLAFIGSPELVTAAAFAGRLSFNPLTDALTDSSGAEFRFHPPQGEELPESGFHLSREGFAAPAGSAAQRRSVEVIISPASERLARLEPFPAWKLEDFENLAVLVKAKGKCTTDHISPAGPWLKYRGHLPNISKNLLLGAVNAFTGSTGSGKNVLTGETGIPLPELAREYKAQGQGWMIVGDENYGEGSSREHAAMEPRYLGCRAVIARSFARIHETNLKKQGLLPLVFADPADYERIGGAAFYDLSGIDALAPGSQLVIEERGSGAGEQGIFLKHTLTFEQIEWFRAGSALNRVRSGQH